MPCLKSGTSPAAKQAQSHSTPERWIFNVGPRWRDCSAQRCSGHHFWSRAAFVGSRTSASPSQKGRPPETPVTYKAGDAQWASNGTAVKWKSWPVHWERRPSLEERLQSSGMQWLDSVCRPHCRHLRRSLLQHGQRPQPQAVFRRRTMRRRLLSCRNQEKSLGMRRIGEPSRCSPTLATLGHKHQFILLCQQLEGSQVMPNWLAPWKKHERCNSHPRKLVREIHQLEPPSKPPQLSLCRFWFDLEKAFDTIPGDGLWAAVSDAAKLKGLSVVLEAGHAGTCYIIRNSLRRLVTKVHVTMGVRQGSVEGPLCFILRTGNTVSCFVDDMVTLLILWRKSQLSRFAEMVSQVIDSGRLRVNKSKLEVLVGAARPGARRINAEIARGAYQFTFRGETNRATTVLKYARRGTNDGHQGHQGPSTIFSWTVGSSFHRNEHQNQAVADAGSEHFAVCSRCSCEHPRDVETLEKLQHRALIHIARSPCFICLESARKTSESGLEYTVVSTLQVRRLLWATSLLREARLTRVFPLRLLPRVPCCEWSNCVCSFFCGKSCPGSCRSLCALHSAQHANVVSVVFPVAAAGNLLFSILRPV